MLDKLKQLLENVSDTYDDFVYGIMQTAKKSPKNCEKLYDYIKNNPSANTSEIITFETEEIYGIKPITK